MPEDSRSTLPEPATGPDRDPNPAADSARRRFRLRDLPTFLYIRLNLAVSALYATAASLIGADLLISLLGVGAGWPIGLPVIVVGLCLMVTVGRLARTIRSRRRKR